MSLPGTDQDVAVDARYRLVARAEKITHLVCCRDVSWRRTFCGAGQTQINLTATVICSMCLDEAEAMRPGCTSSIGEACPVDGNPCPDDPEIDLRIARETS